MIMEEKLITFETAKLAKEKGFDQSQFKAVYSNNNAQAYYPEFNDGSGRVTLNGALFNTEHMIALAPTQSLLQKWLREEHRIHILIDWEGFEPDDISNKKWCYYYGECNTNNPETKDFGNGFDTYEEALEKGLQEALNIIKN